MDDFSFWFGAGLMVVGGLMLVYTKVDSGANEIQAFGVKFKLSHPSLVIIVLGFALIVMNDRKDATVTIPTAEKPVTGPTTGQGEKVVTVVDPIPAPTPGFDADLSKLPVTGITSKEELDKDANYRQQLEIRAKKRPANKSLYTLEDLAEESRDDQISAQLDLREQERAKYAAAPVAVVPAVAEAEAAPGGTQAATEKTPVDEPRPKVPTDSATAGALAAKTKVPGTAFAAPKAIDRTKAVTRVPKPRP
jgi:hypothetical protein